MNNGKLEEIDKLVEDMRKVSPEQIAQAAQAMQAVNLDEVTNETIHIKLFLYKDEPVVDDDGNPFCDEQGHQYTSRVVKGTRTAKIKNIVPVDVYNEAIALISTFIDDTPNKEQLDTMADLVLRCWQLSEPFMTKKMLIGSIDGERIMALFTRFFSKGNPPQNANPLPDGNTTPENAG